MRPIAAPSFAVASAPLLLLLGACAGPPAAEPEPFVYRLPDHASVPYLVTYVSTDTMEMAIRTPMGNMDTNMSSETTYETIFQPADGGLRVEMTVVGMEGRASNPMGGEMTVDESAVTGPLVFLLGARGEVEVLETPEVSVEAGNLFNGAEVASGFFPRLPRTPPLPGESWTDTIHHSDDSGEMSVTNTTVMTYTLLASDAGPGGDLLEVEARGTTETVIEGATQGMEVVQELEGTQDGILLLDPATALLVSADWERSYEGEMEIPAAGMSGMSISMTGRSAIRTQEPR